MSDSNTLLSELRWPEKPLVSSPQEWKRNISFVELLYRVGKPEMWDRHSNHCLPTSYRIHEVRVLFFPSRAFWSIGRIPMRVPENPSEEELMQIIDAYKILEEHGMIEHH